MVWPKGTKHSPSRRFITLDGYNMTEWKMGDPLIVNDGLESWVLYPEDNSYLLALKVESDEHGIRHVQPEITEGLHTWWWRQAVERAEKMVQDLAIPWEQLTVTDLDIGDGNLMLLSEKLARAAYYIVQVNNQLTRLLALQAVAKEMLEHAANRNLAREYDGPKLAIAVRTAVEISRNKPLRNLKIEIIESTAAIKALETVKDSLETLWRTTSRVMSARIKEPID